MTSQPTSPVPTVALLGTICTILVATVWVLAQPAIQRAQAQHLEQQLTEVMAGIRFDNNISRDSIRIDSIHGPITVYRARQNGDPVATIYEATTMRGYSGAIRLLVGIDRDHEITGVRILSHRETPGLGDSIEISKSDWITGFNSLSLDKLTSENWQVKKDGGQFDQFTGATITPRAMVNVVHDILKRHRSAGDVVFQ